MTETNKEKIELFIRDWYYDDASHKFAFELCQYLFEFMDYLKNEKKLAERTLKRHKDNCWAIGVLISQYDYMDETFSPNVFRYPPYHEFTYARKHLASESGIKSYAATCRKLEKYALERGDIVY